MAKRFTDNMKWETQWFQELKPNQKLFWLYVLDKCNTAGVWEVNFKLAEFQIGAKISTKEISFLKEKIIPFDNETKWFVPEIIEFQFGVTMDKLNKENNAHLSVIRIIEKFNLNNLAPRQPLISPSLGAMDKEEEREEEMEMEMDKERDKEREGKILEKWNKFATTHNLSQIIKLTSKREVAIQQRLKEDEFNFELILQKISESDFLLGKVGDWKVDFDFILKEGNYLKILEGKYNNENKIERKTNYEKSSKHYAGFDAEQMQRLLGHMSD